jgi:hypothetical protein
MNTVSKLFNGTWKAFKTLVKAFILLIVLGLIIGVVSGGETTETTETTVTEEVEEVKEKPKAPTVVEKYQLEVLETSTDALGIFRVVGTLTANKDYSYIQIEIPCYDADGYNVGTAIANASNIGKGETWKFEATQFDGGGVDCNIEKADVTGW